MPSYTTKAASEICTHTTQKYAFTAQSWLKYSFREITKKLRFGSLVENLNRIDRMRQDIELDS